MILGNISSVMGLMATVVLMGVSLQPLNDIQMRMVDTVKPAVTIRIQNSLHSLLEAGM